VYHLVLMVGHVLAEASSTPGVSPSERIEVVCWTRWRVDRSTRNAIDGPAVDIVAEIDHDERWGATGSMSVPGAGGLDDRVYNARAKPSPQSRSGSRSPPVCEGLGRAGIVDQGRGHREKAADWIRRPLRADGPPYVDVNQMRSAIKWNRDPSEPSAGKSCAVDQQTADETVATWRITRRTTRPTTVRRRVASHRDALGADWKRRPRRTAADADGAFRAGAAVAEHVERS